MKPEVSRASLTDAIHDTEAFVAANDEVLLVVFRGTTEGSDWATSLNVRTVPVPHTWRVNMDRNINLRMHQVGGICLREYMDSSTGEDTAWCL